MALNPPIVLPNKPPVVLVPPSKNGFCVELLPNSMLVPVLNPVDNPGWLAAVCPKSEKLVAHLPNVLPKRPLPVFVPKAGAAPNGAIKVGVVKPMLVVEFAQITMVIAVVAVSFIQIEWLLQIAGQTCLLLFDQTNHL